MQAFARASHDRNPLHISEDYARKTPYGQPVVFGILGALACLSRLAPDPGLIISKLDLRFLSPMFAGITYSVETKELPHSQRLIRLNDGQRAVLQATATYVTGVVEAIDMGRPQAPSQEAKTVTAESLVPGRVSAGRYEPDWSALGTILEGFDLRLASVNSSFLAGLLWSSYLVGMELPGKQALFSRLTLELVDQRRHTVFFEYEACVRSFDPRFNQLVIDASLQSDGHPVARARLEALLRPESRLPKYSSQFGTGRGAFRDKVGLVIGGSRGLGASLVHALVGEGANVYVNFHRSKTEAVQLQGRLADLPGTVALVQGDGAKRERCEAIKRAIINEYGRLDFLICGAAPAVLPLRIESSAVERINRFISESVPLVTVPLAVFLDLLSANCGQAVVISSQYVHTLPVDLPHYVAAKAAVEAMTVMAARQYPSVSYLIVRPPKLATDLSSSPFAFEPALEADVVAEALVARLHEDGRPGTVLTMDISPEGDVRTEPVTIKQV